MVDYLRVNPMWKFKKKTQNTSKNDVHRINRYEITLQSDKFMERIVTISVHTNIYQ